MKISDLLTCNMYILILILLHFSFTWDTVDEMLSVVTVFKGSDVSLFGQLFEYQGGCSVSWSFLLIKVLTANHGVLSQFKGSPGDNTMDQKWGVITVSELRKRFCVACMKLTQRKDSTMFEIRPREYFIFYFTKRA